MTRKHFEALATGLAQVRPMLWDKTEHAAWYAACNAVADTCEASNGAFDRDRFLTACRTRQTGQEAS